MIGAVLAIILALTLAPPVFAATEYDIRGAGNVSINGAIFEEYTLAGSTGTGVFHPFLQVNGKGGHPKSPVYGFSTDIDPLSDFCVSGVPGTTGIFYTTEPTYQVLLTELPKVTHNGTLYVEFMLDSNQAKNDASRQLSWDQLKVYQTNATAITYPQLSALTPIWDLDSGTDRWIHFDAQFGSGSGQGDMRILIPASLFSPSYMYVIAWVSFGGNPDTDPCADGIESAHPNDDGFEEFGYVEKPVGCLEITKSLSIPGGVPLGPLDGTFTVNVANAALGFSQNVTFTMVNGVITSTNPVTLSGLTPGTYTLSEPGVSAYWTPSGLGDVTVVSDTVCAARTVTNTYTPGCLTITKSLSIPGGVPLGPLDGTFVINVANAGIGFSQNVSFTMVDGVITSTNPVTLNNLIPGTYTLTEPGVPAYWTPSGLGDVVVSSGVSCATKTVTNTYVPGCLTITKEMNLNGYLFASNVTMDFIVNVANAGIGYSQNVTFHVVNGTVANSPQTLYDLIPGTYNVSEFNPGIMWTVTGGGNVNVSSGATCAASTVTNTIKLPHTTISIEADTLETTPGGNVWLWISDTNDGAVPLTSPSVTLLVGANPPIELVKGDAYWSPGGTKPWPQIPGAPNGDANNDGIMDVGETWYWAVQVTLSASTNITVNGHGTDPLGNPVDGPTYSSETGTITVEVGGATRTWGFWKTHLYLVQWMFNATAPDSPHITSIYLGTWKNYAGILQAQNITSVCRYMGLMWSDQAKNSDRTMRKDIDKARIHTAHQALAAIMNSYMSGGASLPAGINLTSIAATLSSNNITAIRNLGSALADYNESGDDVALDPSMPPTGRVSGNIADPQGARTAGAGCISFWNTQKK
jgi:hypothetical protein